MSQQFRQQARACKRYAGASKQRQVSTGRGGQGGGRQDGKGGPVLRVELTMPKAPMPSSQSSPFALLHI